MRSSRKKSAGLWPRLRKAKVQWTLAAILAIFLGTGAAGIDFGRHWDEPTHIDNVYDNIVASKVIPRWHIYPAMVYWLTYLPSVFDGARREVASLTGASTEGSAQRREAKAGAVRSHEYWLTVRLLCLALSSLAIVWAFFAARQFWGDARWGLLSAAILAGSWEFAYHARWIATDTINAQFIALSLWLVLMSLSRRKPLPWLYGAAVATGLATATKYTGMASLLPVLGILLVHPSWSPSHGERARAIAAALGCVLLAFLIASPALLVYPKDVYEHVRFARDYYTTNHIGHTVEPGLDHLEAAFRYVATTALSPCLPLAVVLFSLTFFGVFASWRKNWKTTLALLSFPISYLIVFCQYRIMIVRNYQVLLPYLVLFASGGAALLFRQAASRRAKDLLGWSLAVCLLANALWLVYAAHSIRQPSASAARALAYVKANPGKRIYASPKARAALEALGPLPGNVAAEPNNTPEVLLYIDEFKNRLELPSTGPLVYTRSFGPYSANLRYYSDWYGQNMLAVMSIHNYNLYGIRFQEGK